MTDDNAPVVKHHHAARKHLEKFADVRRFYQELTGAHVEANHPAGVNRSQPPQGADRA